MELWPILLFSSFTYICSSKLGVKSYNVHAAPFTWITRLQGLQASNSDARESTFLFAPGFFFLAFFFNSFCNASQAPEPMKEGNILLTKQLQVKIFSKTPYLVQENEVLLLDQTGSVAYSSSVSSQIGNLWALLEPGLWSGCNEDWVSMLTKDVRGIVGRMPRSDVVHVQSYLAQFLDWILNVWWT